MRSEAVIVTVGSSPAWACAAVAWGRSTGSAWFTVMNVVDTMKKISRLNTTSTIAVMSMTGAVLFLRSWRRLRMSACLRGRPDRALFVAPVEHDLNHVAHQYFPAPLDVGEHLVDAARH